MSNARCICQSHQCLAGIKISRVARKSWVQEYYRLCRRLSSQHFSGCERVFAGSFRCSERRASITPTTSWGASTVAKSIGMGRSRWRIAMNAAYTDAFGSGSSLSTGILPKTDWLGRLAQRCMATVAAYEQFGYRCRGKRLCHHFRCLIKSLVQRTKRGAVRIHV